MHLVTNCHRQILILVLLPSLACAQQTKISPWKPPVNDPSGSLVYRPEPILFVHGINANDSGWSTAIAALQPAFDQYYVSPSIDTFAHTDIPDQNTVQQAYLHTFNYGNAVLQNLPNNAQSYDHIQWNTWADDRDQTNFINIFIAVPQVYRF